MMMKNNINSLQLRPEHDVVLTYTDIEKITEIDHYYISKMKEVRKLHQLTGQEKTGQRAFLHQQWQNELLPYLVLWRVKL